MDVGVSTLQGRCLRDGAAEKCAGKFPLMLIGGRGTEFSHMWTQIMNAIFQIMYVVFMFYFNRIIKRGQNVASLSF